MWVVLSEIDFYLVIKSSESLTDIADNEKWLVLVFLNDSSYRKLILKVRTKPLSPTYG